MLLFRRTVADGAQEEKLAQSIGSPLAASVAGSVGGAPVTAGAGEAKVMPENSYLDVLQSRFEAGGGRESLTRLLYVATIPKSASKQQVC